MPWWQALVLGAVQGVTEFAPVSSSGHLVLTRWAFGWGLPTPALDKAFDVALHAGTLVGAAVFLRRDLARLSLSIGRTLRRRTRPGDRLPWLLCAASVPAAAAGAAFEGPITDELGRPIPIACMLAVGALVLVLADRAAGSRTESGLGMRDAGLVGMAQAMALQPGVSRSGMTIAAARWLGFARPNAARVSFLMSLPLIAGAAGFETFQLLRDGSLAVSVAAPMLIGACAAALTGAAAVWLVLTVVTTRSFSPFVVYRVVLAGAVLTLAWLR